MKIRLESIDRVPAWRCQGDKDRGPGVQVGNSESAHEIGDGSGKDDRHDRL
jgi:hypothetical protein